MWGSLLDSTAYMEKSWFIIVLKNCSFARVPHFNYVWNYSSNLDNLLTWHMKDGMTLWKMESRSPKPLSPVQSALKFSAVFGTIWEKSSMVILPSVWPSAATLRNTCGLLSLECSWTRDSCGEEMHEASPSVWPVRLWHSQKVFLKDSAISGVLNLAASCSTTPSPSGKTEGKTRDHQGKDK